MKKFVKIFAIVIGVMLLIAILVPVLLRGKIDTVVKREINNRVTAHVDYGQLSISLISNFPNASLRLTDLSIVNLEEPFARDTLMSAKDINIVVKLTSLFGDNIEVNRVILNKPLLQAIVDENGKVNWDIMKNSGEETSADVEEENGESSMGLSLRDVRIRNGRVIYNDKESGMAFTTEDLNLNLGGNMSVDETILKMKLDLAQTYYYMDKVAMLTNATIGFTGEVDADFVNSKFVLRDNTVTLNAIEMTLEGWVAMVGEAIDMDLKAKADKVQFKDVLSLIPAFYTQDFKNLTATGELSLDARIKGRMEGDDLPAFNIALGVTNGSFKYAALPRSVDNINITAAITNPGGVADRTIIDISKISLAMAGNAVNGSLRVTTPISDLAFAASANGKVDLGMIKDVYPLEDMTLSGIVNANIKAAGRMSDIEKEHYDRISAEGNFSVENMAVEMSDMPAVNISRAAATITPAAMNLNEMKMTVGRSDISATGSLSNYLGYFFNDNLLKGSLNVQSQLLDLNEFMGEDESAVASPASADEEPLTAVEIPKNLNLSLTATAAKILLQEMTITNFKGGMSIAESTLKLNGVSMNALGGSINVSGSYSTAADPKNPKLAVNAKVNGASFVQTFTELDMVRQMVPLFEKTGGNYNMSINMTTTLDHEMSPVLNTVNATGNIASNNIKLQNIEVFEKLATVLNYDKLKTIEAKDVSIDFVINDGRLSTQPFDIKAGDYKINMSGSTGLDQTIDYTAKVALPAGATGGVLSTANVKIGGTFNSPTVTLGVKEMAEEAIKNVAASAISKVTGVDLSNSGAQAEQIRAQAKAAGDKLIEEARAAGDKLVEEAGSNALKKLAAQKSSDALVKAAEKKAAQLMEEAEKSIAKLQGTEE